MKSKNAELEWLGRMYESGEISTDGTHFKLQQPKYTMMIHNRDFHSCVSKEELAKIKTRLHCSQLT